MTYSESRQLVHSIALRFQYFKRFLLAILKKLCYNQKK